MKRTRKDLKYLGIFMLLAAVACEDEISSDQQNPISNTNASRATLSFDNATSIDGEHPVAPNGNLKINFTDTLYLIDNNDYTPRISVFHEPGLDISGFYVWAAGTDESSYQDVPAVHAKRKIPSTFFMSASTYPMMTLRNPTQLKL